MFFRLKTSHAVALFMFFALLPPAVHFIFHNEKLYRFLFDWLGVFDTVTAVPLFLATGNFIVAGKIKGKRLIPWLAAFVAFWSFLSETSWGMDFTPIVHDKLIFYAGFMTYVKWINDLSIYMGIGYAFVTLIFLCIPRVGGKLLDMGWPSPSTGLYICAIPIVISVLLSGELPYRGFVVREMAEFLCGLWIFLLSSEYGVERK